MSGNWHILCHRLVSTWIENQVQSKTSCLWSKSSFESHAREKNFSKMIRRSCYALVCATEAGIGSPVEAEMSPAKSKSGSRGVEECPLEQTRFGMSTWEGSR
ncbi:hypothetical protein GOP47_0031088 [Adiantum capillus-veneris]|nr:hypothetical protein GOP47_0031088 [Adiantum capillus-veneris]